MEDLPEIRDAVEGRAARPIDSGIRRGADLTRGKPYRASMALLGRTFAYGAGESVDCRQAAQTELTRALGQLLRCGLAAPISAGDDGPL